MITLARMLGLWILVWAIMIAPITAIAATEDVKVLADINGNSPVDAQNKAIDYAKKRAFFLTLAKLAPDKADAIAKSMTTEQIYGFIRGYQLTHEKADGNHYLAEYLVSVSTDRVGRLVVSDDTTATNENAKPVLVLPVLTDGDKTLMWEPDNAWRSIWNSVALERGENLLIVPYGDPEDMTITDSATILGYGFSSLKDMAKRYGTNEIVVVRAQVIRDQTPARVRVTMRRLGEKLDKTKEVSFEVNNAGDAPESLLPNAARDVADQLKEIARLYEGEIEKKLANAKTIALQVEFRRLGDWVKTQDALRKLPGVVQLDVGSINIQSAQATLYYNGTPESLKEIMESNGLNVVTENTPWIISTF